MTYRIALLLIGALLLATPALAQDPMDEQLAAQYFQQGEYEKAILYYERLYRKQGNPYHYDQLFKCHMALQDFTQAEKLVKEQMKRRGDDPRYLVDLGTVYNASGETEKARQQFDKALKGLKPDQGSVRNLANAFARAQEHDLALATYDRGQKLLKDNSLFLYEMAGLHAAKGDVQAMVRSYLDLLSTNESYIQSVQNALSRVMDFGRKDGRTDLLRTELLRKVQREPDKVIFQEMLIWMYIQQKDLQAAFVQSRAMDKRFDEGGLRMMELAEIALGNEDHAMAAKCYDYVISLGRNDASYLKARIGLVKSLFVQVTSQPEPSQEELVDLERRFSTTLSELGRSRSTLDLVRDHALLKAYHLNDASGAITLLDDALRMPGLDPLQAAQLKLDLGDMHLLQGDIWEASLYYSQVDLDFKYDLMGHEARLRNARVSFYAGDFLWAQAQLDVLKTSTSKLIANDAMELSLRITDNIGLDTNMVPLSMYARAELLVLQNRHEEAIAVLDSLDSEHPMHSLGDDILLMRARIAKSRHRYPEAVQHLERIVELYPLDILVDNAMIELGRLHEGPLKDMERAMHWYERIMFEQTGSIFVPEARERFRRLRGDDLEGPQTPGAPHSHP